MTTKMRAKMRVHAVNQQGDSEHLVLVAVVASEYPADGSDENNTFARFTPTANMAMTVRNPDLLGKFAEGDEVYLDFTKVEKPAADAADGSAGDAG